MASLESIRNRSGLVLTVVGLALLAFILGDFFSSGRAIQNSENILGEVNGETIDYIEFETQLKQNLASKYGAGSVSEQNRTREREALWSSMVRDVVLGSQFENLGLTVTDGERTDLMTDVEGGNISPIARQLFGLQNNAADIDNNSIKGQINGLLSDPNRSGLFRYWEDQIAKNRVGTKYNNMVKKALFVTTTEAEDYFNQQGKTVDGRYIYKSYSSIPDTDVNLSDAEIQEYYNAHTEDYPQKEGRVIDYVIFEVKASSADKQEAKKHISELLEDQVTFNASTKQNDVVPGFRNTEDPIGFVQANSDGQFNPAYLPKGALSPQIDEIMHSSEPGTVYGPYFEGNSYKVARLNDVRNDSVQVAILEYNVIPSNTTSNEIFAKAGEFSLQNKTPEAFTAAAEADKSLKLQNATLTPGAKNISGYPQAREVVRWAFDENTPINTVKRFDDGERYIVAIVKEELADGTQALDKVKTQIENVLRREKRQEMIASELNNYISSASDIATLGASAGLKVENVSGVAFSSNTLAGVGFEPAVVGAFFSLDAKQMSAPVNGNNGVFVLQADAFTTSNPSNDITAVQSQLENSLQPRVDYELYKALEEKAEITDNRNKYY